MLNYETCKVNNCAFYHNSQIIINTINFDEFVQRYTIEQRDRIDELRKLLKRTEDSFDLERLKYIEKISALQSKLDLKEQQIKEILSQNAEKDLSKTSLVYKTALRYFMEGNIDKALIELDEEILVKEERDQVESRLLKASLLVLDFRFDEAEFNFKKAIEIIPSWDNYMAISSHYLKLNQFDLAESNYNLAIEHADNKSNYYLLS